MCQGFDGSIEAVRRAQLLFHFTCLADQRQLFSGQRKIMKIKVPTRQDHFTIALDYIEIVLSLSGLHRVSRNGDYAKVYETTDDNY